MGFLGSRLSVLAFQRAGQEVEAEAGGQAWRRQGPGDPGGPTGARRLPPAAEEGSVRRGPLLGWCRRGQEVGCLSRAGPLRVPLLCSATVGGRSCRGLIIARRVHGFAWSRCWS